MIKAYIERKRDQEAMEISWKLFIDSPYLSQYSQLKCYASQVNQWSLWRPKAIEFIRNKKTNRSELVRIFLSEGKVDAAWEEAEESGCSEALWLKLADKRKATYPQDALSVYQRMVEPTINRRNNGAYAEAVTYLKIIKDLMGQLGKESEFADYLQVIRRAHKPKRNLMALLQDW